MNIYHVHDFKEDEYGWNEVGRRKAEKEQLYPMADYDSELRNSFYSSISGVSL